jgi:hypothetical protein
MILIVKYLYAQYHYIKCHYAECRYAECRGALPAIKNMPIYLPSTFQSDAELMKAYTTKPPMPFPSNLVYIKGKQFTNPSLMFEAPKSAPLN